MVGAEPQELVFRIEVEVEVVGALPAHRGGGLKQRRQKAEKAGMHLSCFTLT